MNATAPQLRDIQLPSAAWWPPALGWWLLLGVVVGLMVVAIIGWRVWMRRGTLRAVLREIDAMEASFVLNGDGAALADSASRLLRRVACQIEPDLVGASGEAWRIFVRRHARTQATSAALNTLLEARYRARPHLDATAVCVALRAWCRAAMRSGAREAWMRVVARQAAQV